MNDSRVGRSGGGGVRGAILAALAAAGLAACASTDYADDPDVAREVKGRIAALATLRGADYAANVTILGSYIGGLAVPHLLEALEDDPSARARAGCAMALGRSQDPRAVDALARAAARDANPGVRYTAGFNLCLYRDPRGLGVLAEALRSDDPTHRRDAAAGLRAFLGRDFGFDAVADPEAREAAVLRYEAWLREQGPDRAAMAIRLE